MKNLLVLALLCSFIISCSTTNDVVGNRFLQKRKYTKGYYFNKKNNIRGSNKRTSSDNYTEVSKNIDVVILEQESNAEKENTDHLLISEFSGIEIKDNAKIKRLYSQNDLTSDENLEIKKTEFSSSKVPLPNSLNDDYKKNDNEYLSKAKKYTWLNLLFLFIFFPLSIVYIYLAIKNAKKAKKEYGSNVQNILFINILTILLLLVVLLFVLAVVFG